LENNGFNLKFTFPLLSMLRVLHFFCILATAQPVKTNPKQQKELEPDND